MENLVGYMIPSKDGFKAICAECKPKSILYRHLETPLYPVNLAQYQQHCIHCGEQMNPNANDLWPELFGSGKVVVKDIGSGKILRIRKDDQGDRIYTIALDNKHATPDGHGLYTARRFEWTWV